MEAQMNTLEDYLPKDAHSLISEYLSRWKVKVIVSRKRYTKHGDYRMLPNDAHQITINETTNIFRFLITLVHEISHLVAFKTYGNRIKPHGKHWKLCYCEMMLPFLNDSVFPSPLLEMLALHFENPKASTDSDFKLVVELNKFDPETEDTYIFELNKGSVFKIHNDRKFVLGSRRIKKYECKEISTGRLYLFSPHAKVMLLS